MNYKRSCRTCLYESCNLIPIYDIRLIQGSNSTTVPALIEFCFKVKVLDDGLPQNICVKYANALKCVFDFQVQCYEAANKMGLHIRNKKGLVNLGYVLADIINLPFNAKLGLGNRNSKKHLQRESNEVHDTSSYEHNYALDPNNSTFCSAKPLFYQIVKNAIPFTCLTYNGYAKHVNNSDAESDSDFSEFTAKLKVSRYTQTDTERTPKINKNVVTVVECPACDFEQTDLKVLAKHILDTHTRGKDCLICNSKGIRYIQAHCERHLPERYFCTECNKGFSRYSHFSCHKKIARKSLLLECDTCSERFCLEKDYNWHMKRHEFQENSSNLILICCGREFLGEEELNNHKIHSHASNYKCSICHQIVESFLEYVNHKKSHKQENNPIEILSCPVCKKRFKNKEHLESHKQIVHPPVNDENKVQLKRCAVCFYVCKNKNSLYRHAASHAENQMYSCKLCDRSYSRKKYLHIHIESFHCNLRRYKCDLCKKDFKYSANLATHQSSKMHRENLKAKLKES